MTKLKKSSIHRCIELLPTSLFILYIHHTLKHHITCLLPTVVADSSNLVEVAHFVGNLILTIILHQQFRLFSDSIGHLDVKLLKVAVDLTAVHKVLQAFGEILLAVVQMVLHAVVPEVVQFGFSCFCDVGHGQLVGIDSSHGLAVHGLFALENHITSSSLPPYPI